MLSQSENSERVLTINTELLGFSEGDLQMPAMIEMQKSFCPPDVSICNCCFCAFARRRRSSRKHRAHDFQQFFCLSLVSILGLFVKTQLLTAQFWVYEVQTANKSPISKIHDFQIEYWEIKEWTIEDPDIEYLRWTFDGPSMDLRLTLNGPSMDLR